MLWLFVGPTGVYFLLSPYLCFNSLLYLDLYVLGDDSYVCNVFVRVCLNVLCGHLLGKGLPLGSRLWCLTVSL